MKGWRKMWSMSRDGLWSAPIVGNGPATGRGGMIPGRQASHAIALPATWFTTRLRLGLLFLVASLAGVVLAAFIAATGREASQASGLLVREELPLLEDLGQIEKLLQELQNAHYQLFAYSIPHAVFAKRRDEIDAEFVRRLSRVDAAFHDEKGVRMVRSAFAGYARVSPRLEAVMQAEDFDFNEGAAVLVELSIDAREISEQLGVLRRRIEGKVVAASASAEHQIERIVRLVAAYSSLIFVIALLVAYHIRARARAEDELAYHATHDLVTGQLNRRELEIRIAGSGRSRWVLTIVLIERFDRLVATLGHELADATMRAVAERLAEAARQFGATIFRLDGASLALHYPQSDAAPESVCRTIVSALKAPVQIGSNELLVSMTCGAARFPEDGADVVTLIRKANSALQQARRLHANFFAYVGALDASSGERLAMEAALGHAAERGEFELYYQPQMEIGSKRTIGAEALIRWKHDGKQVSPAAFIPVAEETGLIVGIGDWVLREACHQIVAWRAAGVRGIVVAINVSGRQFQDPRFVESIADALAESGAPPAAIELEITESVIMQDPAGVADQLTKLRAMGIALAIDDFGTGYSSLAYLKQFPVGKLKVDQSFVCRLGADSADSDRAIVEAIVRLGQSLGLRVIAEGVETERHLDQLRELGCDEIQGYLFARPMPVDLATAFLMRGVRPEPVLCVAANN